MNFLCISGKSSNANFISFSAWIKCVAGRGVVEGEESLKNWSSIRVDNCAFDVCLAAVHERDCTVWIAFSIFLNFPAKIPLFSLPTLFFD